MIKVKVENDVRTAIIDMAVAKYRLDLSLGEEQGTLEVLSEIHEIYLKQGILLEYDSSRDIEQCASDVWLKLLQCGIVKYNGTLPPDRCNGIDERFHPWLTGNVSAQEEMGVEEGYEIGCKNQDTPYNRGFKRGYDNALLAKPLVLSDRDTIKTIIKKATHNPIKLSVNSPVAE